MTGGKVAALVAVVVAGLLALALFAWSEHRAHERRVNDYRCGLEQVRGLDC